MSFSWKFAFLWSTELSAMLWMQCCFIFNQSSCVKSRCQSTKHHRLLDNSADRWDTSRRVYDVTGGFVYTRHNKVVACTCSCKYAVWEECVTSQFGGKEFIRACPIVVETRCWRAAVATTNSFQFSDATASVIFRYVFFFLQKTSFSFAIFILNHFDLSS